ncbi:MAG: hypothetical protein WBX15_05100 [Thermoanaerobaculia bacterium]
MRRMLPLLLVLLASFPIACNREKLVPLSEYEVTDVEAKAYNFNVFPGAHFLEPQTQLLRKAHFVLHPKAKEAPPMAMYDTEKPIEEVAEYYANLYGYQLLQPNEAKKAKEKPQAYYSEGSLRTDAQALIPLLPKLGLSADVSGATGGYKGVYVAPTEKYPRVTLQRPYYDVLSNTTVDKTLIILVRE